MDLKSFFADTVLRTSVLGAIPEGSIVHFEIRGDGGGVWTLQRTNVQILLLPDFKGHADCVLRCSTTDFHDLLNGNLDPRQGYLSGKLEVAGDVGIVLGMRRALRSRP